MVYKCESPDCLKRPSFNKLGLRAIRCSKHKLIGDINVKHKKCEYPDCPKIPSFNKKGLIAKRCFKHKLEGDVNVVNMTCEFPGCLKLPSFNKKGLKGKRCSEHKSDGDVNVNSNCEFLNCLKWAGFNKSGLKPKWCFEHKHDDDIDVKNKRCEFPNCLKRPNFNKPYLQPKWCWEHKKDDDVDVHSKRCSHESCLFYNDKYERGLAKYYNPDLCTNCHRSLYPELHPQNTVSKEQFILAEIQRQIPELEEYLLVWDCRLNNCTIKKPDMAWRVKDTLLHVEIDEKGEGHEDNEDRLLELHAVSGCKNHALIRFNPDESVNGDEPCFKTQKFPSGHVFKLYEPSWNHRIPILISTIRKAFDQALENVEVDTRKRKLFF